MTRIIITFALLLLTKFGFTQENNSAKDQENHTITLSIDNFPSNKGKFNVAIYNKEGFLQKPLQSQLVEIVDKKASVTFEVVEPGDYAIVYYHDSNENSMLDFDQYRRPVEDYGNTGTMNKYGPPSFKLSKFTLNDENLTFELKF